MSQRAAGEPEPVEDARLLAAARARQGLRALIAPGLAAGPPGPAAR